MYVYASYAECALVPAGVGVCVCVICAHAYVSVCMRMYKCMCVYVFVCMNVLCLYCMYASYVEYALVRAGVGVCAAAQSVPPSVASEGRHAAHVSS